MTSEMAFYVLIGAVLSPILMRLVRGFVSTARQAQEAPSERLVVTMPSEVRARVEDLQRRVGRARGEESCDRAQLFRMSLATLDMLERRDHEGWRILFETDCPERGRITEQLMLFNENVPDRLETDQVVEPGVEPREVEAVVDAPEMSDMRTRWDRLNED